VLAALLSPDVSNRIQPGSNHLDLLSDSASIVSICVSPVRVCRYRRQAATSIASACKPWQHVFQLRQFHL